MTEEVRSVSRRLRDLCEPIAGSVYFVPEVQERYAALGLADYAQGYFPSRGACLGHPSGELITAAFGVFNPAIVIPAVEAGWEKTDPPTILAARLEGVTAALHRMAPAGAEDAVAAATGILRPVMESASYEGRALFAGLRSLPFPDDPLAQLWRTCDYVRERRGDGHVAAWVAAGCDPIEISLLTELYWGLGLGTYIYTRGWSKDQITAGIARLEQKGYIKDGAFTEEGRNYRRDIESATDAMDAEVVKNLGDRATELFDCLEPITKAVLEARGYPVDPASTMGRDSDQ